MSRDDNATFVAFKVRVTALNGFIAEGECVACDGVIVADRVRETVLDLVRSGAAAGNLSMNKQANRRPGCLM